MVLKRAYKCCQNMIYLIVFVIFLVLGVFKILGHDIFRVFARYVSYKNAPSYIFEIILFIYFNCMVVLYDGRERR